MRSGPIVWPRLTARIETKGISARQSFVRTPTPPTEAIKVGARLGSALPVEARRSGSSAVNLSAICS